MQASAPGKAVTKAAIQHVSATTRVGMCQLAGCGKQDVGEITRHDSENSGLCAAPMQHQSQNNPKHSASCNPCAQVLLDYPCPTKTTPHAPYTLRHLGSSCIDSPRLCQQSGVQPGACSVQNCHIQTAMQGHWPRPYPSPRHPEVAALAWLYTSASLSSCRWLAARCRPRGWWWAARWRRCWGLRCGGRTAARGRCRS